MERKEVEISQKELDRILRAKSAEGRKIIIREHTLWTKTEIAVFAYFKKNNNNPETYMQIARAYFSSSNSNYQKACNNLLKQGYLTKTKDNKFKIHKRFMKQIERGTETVERPIPYLDKFVRKLTKLQRK